MCWERSQSAPVLLQANDVGGTKPAIFALPGLGRVCATILFGDRPRPKESFVPLSIFVHLYLIGIFRENDLKNIDLKNIDAHRVYRAGTGCVPTQYTSTS